MFSNVQEVDVFKDEQQECEDDTASEEKEGTHKLVYIQGIACVPLLVLWFAHSLQPEALQTLNVTWKGSKRTYLWKTCLIGQCMNIIFHDANGLKVVTVSFTRQLYVKIERIFNICEQYFMKRVTQKENAEKWWKSGESFWSKNVDT